MKKLFTHKNIIAIVMVIIVVFAITNYSMAKHNLDVSSSENQIIAIDTVISINEIESNEQIDINAPILIAGGALSDLYDDNNYDSSVSLDNFEEPENDVDEYAQLAIACVNNYVNVRSEANSTSEIVGYMYDDTVANIEEIVDGEDGKWFKINSGNVTGYIKAEYFIAGDDARDVMGDYVTGYATIVCNKLNVRKSADVNAERVGFALNGEKFKVLDNQGDWLKIQYTDSTIGYVATEYTDISEEFTYARTIEEDANIKAAYEEYEARVVKEKTVTDKSENLTKYVDTSIVPASTYANTSELRKSIVDYALQFTGGPYVFGGNSLTNGTDCSGFTMLIYKHFGYNLSRIPQGQLDGIGRKISYDEIQPGDLVFYSPKGVKATHAAIYIGNGQVVHAANRRDGILVTSVTWTGPVYGIKNVID